MDIKTGQKTTQHRLREVLRRKIAGESHTDIAKAMGLGLTTVSRIANSPEFKKQSKLLVARIDDRFVQQGADRFKSVARELIQEKQELAAQTLIGLLEDDEAKPEVLRRTALDVLSLGGYEKVEQTDNRVALPAETLHVLVEALKESNAARTDSGSSSDS